MIDTYVGSNDPIERRILRDIDGAPAPLQPWAEKVYQDRISSEHAGHTFPSSFSACLPHGVPQIILAAAYPVQILQTPGQVTFIHELGRQFRLIYLDRPHLPDPDNNFYGDSVGRWEGDTLVIDTIGLTKRNTLDMLGMPTSDQMHVIERIRRPSPDKLEVAVTIDDPGTFTRPWTVRAQYSRQARSIEVMEYICLDGNDSLPSASK